MLDKLPNINQWRKDFLIETFILFLSIRGRINFLQLARYGKHKEQRYRFSSGKLYKQSILMNKPLRIGMPESFLLERTPWAPYPNTR